MNITESIYVRSYKHLTYGEKLLILRQCESGITTSSIANQLSTTETVVVKVSDLRERQEIVREKGKVRNSSTLEDKLLVLHYIDKGKLRTKIAFMFKVRPRTISRISKKRACLIEQDRKRVPKDIKRPLYAKFLAIDSVVIEFIRFARSQRLPVTLRLTQVDARKEADKQGILNFHASRGWVEKFLRRYSVQPSFRLHRKGDVTLPTDHAERIQDIREISAQYQLIYIRNMDESSLFYRNGPRRSYLTNNGN